MRAPVQAHPPDAIDPQVAQAAADWFARASAGALGEADHQAWMAWRQSDPAHEQAWQRVESVSRRFGLLLPDAGMAALDRQGPYRRRQALRSLAIVAIGGGAGWLAWQQSPWRDWAADYRTATGERREFTLADGTRLLLNTATAVDVRFNATERRIDLRHGEIQVTTASDAQQRPLVVATRFGQLWPVGTRFIVRQDDAFVRLTVLEGAVQVQPASPQVGTRVLAGERVQLNRDGISAAEPAGDGADAWTGGLLMADGMSLAAFTAELARYRPGMLSCDPAVAGLRLSGAFPLDDTDRALAAVTRALPVRIQRLTRYWVRISPA